MTAKRKSAKRKTASKKRAAPARRSSNVRAALSRGTPAAARVSALRAVPTDAYGQPESLRSVIDVLRNREEPMKVRLAALQALQAASFSVIEFAPVRGDYIAALRAVSTDDDPELRQRVLGILMREKDGFAQKKLLEGLRNPDKALVPPEKALQLLGYDLHAEAYAAAREILDDPPSAEARHEALRLLAADAAAAPMFEKILRDKDELAGVRQLAAQALQALRPQSFQKSAREIVLDESDYEDIKAASLTALATFGGEEVANDQTLMQGVDRLRERSTNIVKQSARRFLAKYGK